MTYFWLMEIKELPEDRKHEAPEHFHSRMYGVCEGILDARRDLNIPWDKHTRKAMHYIYLAQKHHANWLYKHGDNYYCDWSRWSHLKAVFSFKETDDWVKPESLRDRLYHLKRSLGWYG